MTVPDVLMLGPYPEWDMSDLEDRYALHKLYEADDKDAALAAVGSKIRAVATRGELGAGSDLMAKLPNLELVSVYGVGTDGVDLAYARDHGIAVTNTPDVLTEDVADLAVGLMLAVSRAIVLGDLHVRSNLWPSGNLGLSTRMHGKRVGIVGMGRIGSAVARRLVGFGCVIGYCNRTEKREIDYPYFRSPVELARWSDFLVVTVSGGQSTRDLIGADAFAALGSEGIFINLSRGTTVDEEALISALDARTIRAAGLDVFKNEPRIDRRFLTLENVVLQPHHASGTVETRKAMGQLVRDNLAAHFAGAPLLTPVS